MRRVGELVANEQVGNQRAKVIVVIGLGRDKTLTELKGQDRPVNPWRNRAYTLASSRDIDYVVSNDDKIREGKIDFSEVIKQLGPDIFVLNADDSGYEYKVKLCHELKIKLIMVERVVPKFLKPVSSTEIIKSKKEKLNIG